MTHCIGFHIDRNSELKEYVNERKIIEKNL